MNKYKTYRPWVYMLLMLLICLAPFVVANYLYRHHKQIHFTRHYHGQLYSPMPKISSSTFMGASGKSFSLKKMHGKWLLIYTSTDCCKSTLCMHNIYNLRAMRGILIKDQQRFHSFIIMPSYCRLKPMAPMISKDDSVTSWFATTDMLQKFQSLVDLNSERKLNWSGQHLFFVDPNGYLVMHFLGTQSPTLWLQDFKLLLKVGQHA